jgi:hypothetical protein
VLGDRQDPRVGLELLNLGGVLGEYVRALLDLGLRLEGELFVVAGQLIERPCVS